MGMKHMSATGKSKSTETNQLIWICTYVQSVYKYINMYIGNNTDCITTQII